MMNRQNVEDIYPLSPMQQGMLFHSLYAPNSGVYVEQLGLEICGHLDIAALEQAWQRCVDHHASLRTAFVWEKLEQPLQVVGRQVTIKINQQDWQSFLPEEQQARLDDWLQADQQQGFALSKAPLMRLTLIHLGKERAYFLWSHHHLLLDGWSAALLLQQVLGQYQAFCQGQTLALDPAPPYRNYIAWQQQQDGAVAEGFWRRYLHGLTAPAKIQAQPSREAPTPRHGEQTVPLTTAATEQLQRFGQQQRLTLGTLIQGAWAVLLSRHSGSAEVVFGTTVSGRSPSLSGSEAMIGLLINTLPVRTQITPGIGLIDWLQQLQTQQAEARQYDYTPLSQIQQWSDIAPGTPLFESLLVVENYPVAPQLGSSGLHIRPMRTVEQTNYPLTAVVELGASLTVKLIYDRDRFSDDRITRLGQHFQTLLETLPTCAQQPLSALSILPPAERQRVLVDWNQTALPLPEGSLQALFEQQAERTPDAVAVVFETQCLTYQDLNQQANQLAHYLRTVGIGPESLVGICLERSATMVVALLGILKAGAAYVPLDPSFPANRLCFMVQDSQIALLITNSSLGDRLAPGLEEQPHQPQILCLDAVWNLVLQQPHSQLEQSVQASSLAYVIYTSGSTGQPKGVMIEHPSVVNFLLSLQQHLQLTPEDRLLAVTTLSFDIAVLELWLPLTIGAQVAIAPQTATRDAQQLMAALETHQATVMQATPATWRMLLSAGWSGKADLTILSGGEALPCDLADQLLPKGNALWNLYGPTETTVWSTLQKVTATADGIAIGRPIHNTQVYVLDESLQPMPIGVTGELYIGGAGLARGYWQRPELTAERFIENPFTAQPSCLYKTGDLARYRADGTLEHLGRLDHQVKLRGYRIELGEIEAVLRQQPEVKDAVVVAQGEPGDQRLVAYGVFLGESFQAELRERLRSQLPDYMVPAVFVKLEALPLTPNGKVDRLALPKPEAQSPVLSSKAEPQTELEQAIATIWQQVLKTDSIGRDDNFFALGGHSLLATQVVSRLRQVLQRDVPIRLLFEAPTVAALAQHLEPEGPATADLVGAIQPAQREQPLPLSFAQERLWVLDQLEPGDASYNISTAVELTGELNLPALEQSLNIVIQRHESLRTTFVTVDGLPVQAIAPQLSITLHHSGLRALPAEQQPLAVQSLMQAEARQPFDLAQGPLLRSQLLHLADNRYVLLFSLHHIIADAWSMGVLIREVTTCYRALINGEDPSLPKLPIQYGDLAVWQRQWLQTPNATGVSPLQRHIDYWQQQLKAPLPVLQLPTDFPRPATPSHRGALQSFTLLPELGRSLHQLSQRQGVSLFMTCLAAFQILLYRYTQQEDIVIGTDVANRNRAETETLIGFLVNILVLRTDLSGDPTFEDLLSRVREVTLDAYAHQDLPFAKLVEALNPVRSRHQTPLFQVLFVLQNTPMPPLALDHLTLTPLAVDNGTAKFDLALFLTETAQGIQGQWNYRSDLFKPETLTRFSQAFTKLLQQVVTQPQARLAELAGISIPSQPSQAMTTPPPQPSKRRSFKSIKSVQPKPIQWAQQELVRTSYLTAAPAFPLVIEPQDDATDLKDWAANHRPWLEQQLQQHGAILFRGFDLGAAPEFEQVAQAICPDLFGDYGDLPREGMGGKVYGSTPYPAEQAIRFHNESSHLHRWPMKIWFFCVQAAQQGGETPIIDCRKAYQLLSPSLRQHLQTKQLMYVRTFTAGLDVRWQDFFQTSDRTAVEAACRRHHMQVEWTAQGLRTRQICPAVLPHPKTGDWVLFNQIQLHHGAYLEPNVRRSLGSVLGEAHLPRQVYYGDGSPLEETALAELDAVYEQAKVQFDWQPQDLLMLDNMLVAHGRNPFVGPRKIVVAMGEMTGDRDGQNLPLGEVSHAATR